MHFYYVAFKSCSGNCPPINTRTTLLVEYAFWEGEPELLARYELAHIPGCL